MHDKKKLHILTIILFLGMKLMVQHLVDNLEFFKEEEHWKEEHYVWCHDFLTDPE